MHPALETRELTKVYGEKTAVYEGIRAVSDVSLSIPRGALYGLVGANGAGKTTFLSMATGLLRPTTGTSLIDGVDVWADPIAARGRIGLLPDGPTMSEALPGLVGLRYVGVLQGLSPDVADRRARQLLAVLDIADAAEKPVSNYSAGMRKKIGLAAALIHSPALLVLDEPFEAVDPVSAVTIRNLLQQFTSTGGTVVLSSHSMGLIEQLCTHVAILNRGALYAAGPTEEVRAGGSLESVLIDSVGPRVGLDTPHLDWLADRAAADPPVRSDSPDPRQVDSTDHAP
ncbi:ABC transporter ATP-binding protein [Williamsia sp. CHRR-6]|uniref:ABC transporter ATP-binding protein n=1 Tax=Williamsia sp. CHRR-6 TaxID=2835871 RepID=UPI001BD9CE3C|nr:ABC transporter ATP-binding protein [Williamsia sp. CHRR-6]MBT0565745.1 ABC transporter ATP-binding protein [Williamsia sp. CHRR-6]